MLIRGNLRITDFSAHVDEKFHFLYIEKTRVTNQFIFYFSNNSIFMRNSPPSIQNRIERNLLFKQVRTTFMLVFSFPATITLTVGCTPANWATVACG
jgi:hypothetical protein